VIEFIDDEESVALRKCYWEFMASDRSRFADRISRTQEDIGYCFKPEHREKIYRERFQQNSSLSVEEEKENDPDADVDDEEKKNI